MGERPYIKQDETVYVLHHNSKVSKKTCLIVQQVSVSWCSSLLLRFHLHLILNLFRNKVIPLATIETMLLTSVYALRSSLLVSSECVVFTFSPRPSPSYRCAKQQIWNESLRFHIVFRISDSSASWKKYLYFQFCLLSRICNFYICFIHTYA